MVYREQQQVHGLRTAGWCADTADSWAGTVLNMDRLSVAAEDSECNLLSAVETGHFDLGHCCIEGLVVRPGAEAKVVAVEGCTGVGSAVDCSIVAAAAGAAAAGLGCWVVRVREIAPGFVWRRLPPNTTLSHTSSTS